MTRIRLTAASLAVVAAMVAIGAAVASSLPAEMQLPTHWGIDGRPDAFSDKWTALLMPAVLAGGLSLLFYALPALESRRKGFERSRGLYLWSWAGLLLFSLVIQLAVVSTALGWAVDGTRFILGGLGILFFVIGNQLGKSRSMYLIGIRTPWTLASEEVWIKTHRLAGKLMVGAGLVLMAAALLALPPDLVAPVMISVIGAAVLIPAVYSYVLWRQELRRP